MLSMDSEKEFKVNSLGSKPRLKIFLQLIAPVYDLLVGFAIRHYARQGMALLPPVEGMTALDVCTGTGIIAETLWKHGAQVTAIDFSEPMLNQASKKLSTKNIALYLMDARKLTFPDKSFDLVTISMALHEIKPAYRDSVLSEIQRVSRKYVLIIEHYGVPANPIWRAALSLIEQIEGSNYKCFIMKDLETLLQRAGLKIIKLDVDRNICLCLCQPGS